MNWHTEQLQELIDRLDALAVAARQMLAVLQEEHTALYHRDPPTPELLHEKARLAGIIETEQATFSAFRSTLNTDNLESSLAEQEAPAAHEHWVTTRSLLQQCDHLNEVNGRLLNRLHTRNRLFDRVLRQQVTEPTYSRSGQLGDGRQGSLGRA
ncbi:flagellar protein FlgN [Natronospirillum operosum]|uniref:Flagellar protein FlgN n=1 Tax=Natronospirillum operosum TaxID=2759953 RepID=A0A4Z0WL91_9GAMM|nr:flagellar protein FlgN [Natronospirillum operosum]TGG96005.1 flagellar protein FlgN [Natronospirillum operosum]